MITIYLDEHTINIQGHAEYAEPGKDIVCSAVSAILQTAQLGLYKLAEQYPNNIQIELDVEEFK